MCVLKTYIMELLIARDHHFCHDVANAVSVSETKNLALVIDFLISGVDVEILT